VAYLDELMEAGLLAPTGVHGSMHGEASSKHVRSRFDALVTRTARPRVT